MLVQFYGPGGVILVYNVHVVRSLSLPVTMTHTGTFENYDIRDQGKWSM